MRTSVLSGEFEYEEKGDLVFMFAERECGPFDKYLVGTFVKGLDGNYRFTHSQQEPMTCKMLREAAKKCGALND